MRSACNDTLGCCSPNIHTIDSNSLWAHVTLGQQPEFDTTSDAHLPINRTLSTLFRQGGFIQLCALSKLRKGLGTDLCHISYFVDGSLEGDNSGIASAQSFPEMSKDASPGHHCHSYNSAQLEHRTTFHPFSHPPTHNPC